MTLFFSPLRIAAALQIAVPDLTIEAVAETGSTNADLLERLEQLRAPVLLIAGQQTAGRGRAGRVWHSDGAASLTFSLAWRFDLPVQALAGLPLAIGVGLAEALARLAIPVQLKWPNDVLCDGRKLAGVLIETAQTRPPGSRLWAVIGIGINLCESAALASRVGQPIATLATLPGGERLERDLLMAALLDQLCLTLQEFEQHGFSAFSARWNALHLYRGQQVNLVDHGKIVLAGAAFGVDDQGRLLIDTVHGRSAVVAGDVSLHVPEAG